MHDNPFRVPSPEHPPHPRKNMVSTVAGLHAAKALQKIDRGGSVRKRFSADFSLSDEERIRDVEARQYEALYKGERERLFAFFGKTFEIPLLPREIDPKIIEFWKQNHFELQYWPSIRMEEDEDFPGWEHKPGRKYADGYGVEFFGKILEIQEMEQNRENQNLQGVHPLDLLGRWVLKDTRQIPNYKNGEQVYENDELFMQALGPRNKIAPKKFDEPQFWDPLVRALHIDRISGAVMRLPRVIEANVMGQGEGFQDRSTREVCEEYSYVWDRDQLMRFTVGDCHYGGASHLSWTGLSDRDLPHDGVGCRPLVVLPPRN